MRDQPIIIIGLPRSGTSMVAGLFARHGVFTGNCKEADERNRKGFFEHVGFTSLVLELYGKGIVSKGIPVNPHPGLKRRLLEMIDKEGYEFGPWLIKHAPVYYPIWGDFEPKFIFVRRDTESITRSAEGVGWRTTHIAGGQELLSAWAHKHKAPQVLSNELIRGNYISIQKAFEYCGLTFDEHIAADFIEPALWKHSQSLEEDNTVVMRDKNYLKPNFKKGQKHA